MVVLVIRFLLSFSRALSAKCAIKELSIKTAVAVYGPDNTIARNQNAHGKEDNTAKNTTMVLKRGGETRKTQETERTGTERQAGTEGRGLVLCISHCVPITQASVKVFQPREDSSPPPIAPQALRM